jgi:cytochrome P450 family 6
MILAVLVSILILVLTFIIKRRYGYWKMRGVSCFKPSFPFGNIKSVARKEKSFGVAVYDLYNKSDKPFVGLFILFQPMLLVRDKDLVKNILTNDFESFHDRGVYCNPESDPMSAHLFSLPGKPWKSIRNKITPAFTSGKLKGMFSHIKFVADSLVKYLEPMAEKGETIVIFDFAHRFVVDCLASVAFGQEGISTINDPNHKFMTVPDITNNESFLSAMRSAGLFAFPG